MLFATCPSATHPQQDEHRPHDVAQREQQVIDHQRNGVRPAGARVAPRKWFR